MSRPDESQTPAQPSIAELMARYVQQRSEAQVTGLVSPDATAEVTPFDAAPVQTVDPRLAWDEALAALRLLGPQARSEGMKAPPDWPLLVASQEPAVALAFAVGNFPQLVRHVQPILHAGKLTDLRPSEGRAIPVPGLIDWAEQQKGCPEAILALGALRLAGQFALAGTLLARLRKSSPWQNVLANEEAALAWHAGRAEEAAKLWKAQPDSIPVLFNRGMAALFMGKPADARSFIQQAIKQLPEESAWHHLGQLYLALAQMRR